ncbi:MAG: hypothetical protein A2W91_14325 [Bacteroidetes bacterium GWF2_38_335]|nr:MAG: hypothetical protein A2W91_14325 [Bacteroidetes bacterium GWF2_38_335]OFY79364.1 MAG: hypothetical protein A2281_16830 [Bacteroidetes bacterium RIFOXYA12_FULL_38_20]HBS85624.1 hypothetical protein [Bacteroidales bacterium]
MEYITVFLIALGLSFDSFAVSVCSGLKLPKIVFWSAVKIAFFLAFFQAAMPVLGWLLGNTVKVYIVDFDHWIAFGLLAILGGKMIYEGFQKHVEDSSNPLHFWVLIGMSLATSIDAFAVGITFSFMAVHIILAALIIGAVTFIVSMTGILIGKKTGAHFGKKMEVVGGLILVGIGVKIMVEHLFFA